MRYHFPKIPVKVPGCVILLLVLFVPAALMAYVLHNPAWMVGVPIGILGLIFILAFTLGVLGSLFGIGRRKGSPEQFANALEGHLFGEEPERGWDDLMDVELADPRLAQVQEQIRQRLNNFDTLASEEDKVKLRAIIADLRSGNLPDMPSQSGIMRLFRFRK